jgi:hypothetical protein
MATAVTLTPCGFGLYPVRSPLLGASLLFSFPPATEMFHFAGFPSTALCVQAGMTRHDPRQVFPFGHPRIEACLAAPRGLSQPATSFIGFQRLGIHRVPLTTCRDDARARYGVPNEHTQGPHPAPANPEGLAVHLTDPSKAHTFRAAQRAHATRAGTTRS